MADLDDAEVYPYHREVHEVRLSCQTTKRTEPGKTTARLSYTETPEDQARSFAEPSDYLLRGIQSAFKGSSEDSSCTTDGRLYKEQSRPKVTIYPVVLYMYEFGDAEVDDFIYR
jgi:hypothetical protein